MVVVCGHRLYYIMDTLLSLIIYLFRVVVVSLYNIPCCCCVPGLRQGHKSKNETRITPRSTDWSFTDSFFDDIELMILGF